MDLSLHPQPCRDSLTLLVPDKHSSAIAVVNILSEEGALVHQEIHYSERMIVLSTANLAPAHYRLVLATLEGELHAPFTKIE